MNLPIYIDYLNRSAFNKFRQLNYLPKLVEILFRMVYSIGGGDSCERNR